MYKNDTGITRRVEQLLGEATAVRLHNLKKSIALAEEALVLARQTSDLSLLAQSISKLAFFCMIGGEYERSVQTAAEAAGYYETLQDERGLADARYTIASVHYKTENMHLGLKYLIDCLATYRKYDDYPNQARAYKSLGTIYEAFGDVPNAIDSYESAIAAAKTCGDINMKTNAYNPLSGLYLNQGNTEKAMEIIERSIRLKKETGDLRGLAFAYYGRGKIFTSTGAVQSAAEDFHTSIDIHTEMGEQMGLCMSLQKLGILYMNMKQFDQAIAPLERALKLSEIYKYRIIKTRSSYLLYETCKQQQQTDKALKYLEIHQAEQDANSKNQTQQIVDSYTLIHKMEANALQDKMQLEKAEIMKKKEKAEYAAKARQDFLSNMSHEIRTPLNAIITITNLLKEKSDNEEQQLVDSLRFASDNLLLLINDILDFSKLDTGKMELEKRPVLLSALLQKIKNTYESMAKEKGLSLVLEIPALSSEAYELDEIKLAQVLGNLLSNAIKFTDQGSVRLIVEKVGIETAAGNATLRFKVVDTGIGIPNDFLGEIFDSFTQPKSVTTKKHRGSGLGLAIVKKLVQLHESDVHIDTQLGNGSTFYFDLVLTPGKVAQAETPYLQPKLKRLAVLLAEDNAINTMVATRLLGKWGIAADCAKNGLEAVEKAASQKYDIILMDIHMPEMNGYDATKHIRQPGSMNQHTTIYALTADIMASSQTAYDGFFNGFLLKPIETRQLYHALSGIASEVG